MPLMLASLAEALRGVPLPEWISTLVLLPDIGSTAMPSDPAGPKWKLIYYESNPCGSHNHGHAGRNAFVLHAGGQALLEGTGKFDFHDSEHAGRWCTTTKAPNAPTFDGGIGQLARSTSSPSRLVSSLLTCDYCIVTVDATPAYGVHLPRCFEPLSISGRASC